MIEKIAFSNYKSFAEGEIKIKPITILLGANSVGKSSILQLLLMLQQTALSEKNYQSPLKLHGGFVSMGEGLNLIRKKDRENILSLELSFQSKELKEGLRNLCGLFYREVMSAIQILKISLENSHNKQDIPLHEISNILNKNMRQTNPDILSRKVFIEGFKEIIEEFFKGLKSVELEKIRPGKTIDSYLMLMERFADNKSRATTGQALINEIKNIRDYYQEYLFVFNFLACIAKNIKNDKFIIKYELACKDKALYLKGFTFSSDSIELFKLNFECDKQFQIRLLDFTCNCLSKRRKYSLRNFPSVKKVIFGKSTIFKFTETLEALNENGECISPFFKKFKLMIDKINSTALDYFDDDGINYVSPLRAHPKRYYFLDKAKMNVYLDTLDGDAIAEILKDNAGLKSQVNTWLNKFNLKVNVEHLEDIIHRLQVNQNSLDLDITDVGFGISQVLPVIIQGFLSHKGSITLIEQPEIHLHPKMQADLADLFIEIVSSRSSNPSKYLVIETHSEYLLKRLRRRISEKHISSENVAIYLIDPDNSAQGAVIKELKIEEKGQFAWPVDFYGGELLKDTTEFLKNQYN
jgi:predicted ATPase